MKLLFRRFFVNIMNNEYITINKKAFDKLCVEYEKRAKRTSHFGESPEALGDALLKHVKKQFDRVTLLEVGPGSGQVLRYFSENTYQTVAVDLSEKMAIVAKQASPASIIICDNILNLSFLESQFEAIFACALIHLFPLNDARILLNKFYLWLKPNGFLFVNTTIHERSEEGLFKKDDYPESIMRFRRRWTEQELIDETTRLNFSITDKLFTNELDRDKKWIALILQKRRN